MCLGNSAGSSSSPGASTAARFVRRRSRRPSLARAARASVSVVVILGLLWGPYVAAAQAAGPPLKPASLVVTEVGNRQVTLRWVAGGDGGSPVVGWQYRVSSDGTLDTEAWTDIAGGDVRSYTVRSLMNGQQYSFQVRALNDSDGDPTTENAGPASDTVTAAPSAASMTAPERPGLQASGSDASVELSFVTLDDGGSPLRGWQYRRSTDTGADKTWSAPASISSTELRDSYVVTGLTNGTEYFFQVRVANGAGALEWSGWSETASATPRQPVPPTGATVTGSSLVVTFASPLDTTSVPDHGHFTAAVNGEVVDLADGPVAVAGSTATLTLASAVSATGRAELHYTRGSPSLQGADGAPVPGFSGLTVTNQTANGAPMLTSPPTTLTVAENSPPGTAVMNGMAAAQFAATDADGDTLVFSLRDSVAGSGHAAAFRIDPSSGHVTVAEKPDFETRASHAVTVEVTDGIDTATQDVTVNIVDEDPPGPPRPSPHGTKIAKPVGNALRIAWQPPTSDGGTPVTAYRVYWYKTSDIDAGSLEASEINRREVPAQAGEQNFTITGLSDGTEYGVSLTAVNREGESAFPAPRSMIPAPATLPYTHADVTSVMHLMPDRHGTIGPSDFRANTQPRNVVVTAPASGSLNVAWDPPTASAHVAQFYRVRWSSTTSLPDEDSDAETACGTACMQIDLPSSTLEHTITGLTVGQQHSIVVEYFYKATAGSETTEKATAFASGTALGPAAAPANLVATPGDEAVELSWDAPPSTGGLALARYEVRWGPAGGTMGNPVDAGLATTYSIAGLTNEQAYDVQVRAVTSGQDDGGNARTHDGAWTATASAAPNGAPQTGPVNARTSANTPKALALSDIRFVDDTGDTLAELIVAEAPQAAHGRLRAGGANLIAGSRVARAVLEGSMPLTFVPALDFSGTASFTFRVVDGDGAVSGTASASVTVVADSAASSERPSIIAMSLVSDPGRDGFYVAGDEVQVQAHFTSAVTVTGVPQLVLQLAGGRAPTDRVGIYKSGSGTAVLNFGYTVQAGDNAPGGIRVGRKAIAGVVRSATPRDGGGFDDASLAYAGIDANPMHRVDTAPPVPSSVLRVSGDTVTVTFNEPLAATMPATAAFDVRLGSSEDPSAVVNELRVSDSQVMLQLAEAVGSSQPVTVDYTAATAGPGALRDVAGNPVADFEARRVFRSRGPVGGGSGAVVVPQRSGVLVVANGWSPADVGIAAAMAAQMHGGALLYVSPDGLSGSSRSEIGAYNPERVLVVGGAEAVSSAMLTSIGRAAGVSPQRIAGDSRVTTAVASARRAFAAPASGERTVVIANGWQPDHVALAALLAADAHHGAVLYTEADSLPPETAAALRRHSPDRVVIAGGGSHAISLSVRTGVAAAAPGADLVSEHSTDSIEAAAARARSILAGSGAASPSRPAAVLVNGDYYADVAVSAVLSAHADNAVVLFTESAVLSPAAEAVLRDHAPDRVFIVGGHTVVSAAAEARVREVLGNASSVDRLSGKDRVDTANAVARRLRRDS